MANGLYSRVEISVMTDDGLDELLSYYLDTGNDEGVLRVTDEVSSRQDDRDAEREIEMQHEADQERRQRMHDEMTDSMLADVGLTIGSYGS